MSARSSGGIRWHPSEPTTKARAQTAIWLWRIKIELLDQFRKASARIALNGNCRVASQISVLVREHSALKDHLLARLLRAVERFAGKSQQMQMMGIQLVSRDRLGIPSLHLCAQVCWSHSLRSVAETFWHRSAGVDDHEIVFVF